MINIHQKFTSESQAYRAASDALSGAYDCLAEQNHINTVECETALQVARMAHCQCACEYLAEIRGESGPPAPHVGLNVEGLLRANGYDE